MQEQNYLANLPNEILDLILNNEVVSPMDVCNCSLTCKSLLYACRKDIIWSHKFKHFYPTLFKYFGKRPWFYAFASIFKLRISLKNNILALSQTFLWSTYHDYEWPDIPRRALELYEPLFDDDIKPGCGKYYIVDECYNIMHGEPINTNLTLKYYAEKLYCHFNETHVVQQNWEEFLNEVNHKVCYEKALLITSQSLQPTFRIHFENVTDKLQNLVSVISKKIMVKYPDLISRKKSQASVNSINSIWNESDCVLILEEIHAYMKHDLNFVINETFDYRPDNYCVDKVLNNLEGSSKILIALEACIAFRLGIVVEIHKNTNSWKLFFNSYEKVTGYAKECAFCKDSIPYESIDLRTWNDGLLIDAIGLCRTIFAQLVFLSECRLRGEWWQAGEPVVHDLLKEDTYSQPIRCLFTSWEHVEHWKISQLRHYRCQLKRVSQQRKEKITGKILHLNILLRINSKLTQEYLVNLRRDMTQPPSTLKDLIGMVGNVNKRAKNCIDNLKPLLSKGHMHSLSSYASLNPYSSLPWTLGLQGGEIPQKRRLDRMSWQVHFAVGQVLEQRTSCGLCVAYDWDSMCVETEDTLVLMGETSLLHGTDQPFYRVLMNNGIARYIAQESLRPALNPRSISNPLLGRYFVAFLYPHYIPNPHKAYEYPEDATVREQIALKLNLL